MGHHRLPMVLSCLTFTAFMGVLSSHQRLKLAPSTSDSDGNSLVISQQKGLVKSYDIESSWDGSLDTKFFLGHQVKRIEQMSFNNENTLWHIHHACLKGGEAGLVVPHLGGVLGAAANPFIPGHFPGGSSPTAFRMFTFEEAVGLFGTGHERHRFHTSPIKAETVSQWVGSFPVFLSCSLFSDYLIPKATSPLSKGLRSYIFF